MTLEPPLLPVHRVTVRFWPKGAAVCLPPWGIWAAPDCGPGLLRHEQGHGLQYRQRGFLFYYLILAPLSLGSAFGSVLWKPHRHFATWVERHASRLAYEHYGRPLDWDLERFPVGR